MDCDSFNSVIDVATPYSNQLSAFYKRSYAFYTTKVRWSKILKSTQIQFLEQHLALINEYGDEVEYDIELILTEIDALIGNIETNKQLEFFDDDLPDVLAWNEAIKNEQAINSLYFFSAHWLIAECYLYRKLINILWKTKLLKDFDLFRNQKIMAFEKSFELIQTLSKYVVPLVTNKQTDLTILKREFVKLMKINLWGNQCDLSLSVGSVEKSKIDPVETVEQLNAKLLIDDSDKIWTIIQTPRLFNDIIIFVCDNASYELFCDMCLADFLISHKFCTEVHFYLKTIPWFISDALEYDFHWLIENLMYLSDNNLSELSIRWRTYVSKNLWRIKLDYFWTLPHSYNAMEQINPCLYDTLSVAKLCVFKGDLNYRKLIGDIKWNPCTPFDVALQYFHPCNLCSLRTVKADLICGLSVGVADYLDSIDPEWLISGDYATICFDGNLN